jgi:hypothetical protein
VKLAKKWTALDETMSCQFGRYDDESTARKEAQRRAGFSRHAYRAVQVEVRKDERRLPKASCEICGQAVPELDDIILRTLDILACANKDCRRAATTKVPAGHVAVSSTRAR